MTNTTSPRLSSLNKVCAQTSYSRTWVMKLIERGEFPRPVRIGERRFAFVQSEVDAWIEARIAAREAGQ